MKEIILSANKGIVLVDDEDYEFLSQWNWHLCGGYAVRWERYGVRKDNKRKTICMHRVILGLTNPKIHTDHINMNGLDNRKENLRACLPSQNSMNIPKRNIKNATSIYKGVRLDKRSNRWEARIVYYRKQMFIGTYATEIEAGISYDKKAKELYGEFAVLNFKEVG